MDGIKVSIIIPVYNVEKYLAECLDSALAQTLQPIEIICVDDGSTDSSPEILDRYAAACDSLRVIRKENGGLSSARNAGLAAAQGEYILSLDSDDRLTGPDALESLYNRAAANHLDVLFFDSKVFYETDELRALHPEFADFGLRHADDAGSGPELLARWLSDGSYLPSVCLQLLRREFLDANRLTFELAHPHEDEVFTVQCLCQANRAARWGVPAYDRRVRPDSIMTATSRTRSIRGYCEGAALLTDFVRSRLANPDEKLLRELDVLIRDLCDRALRVYAKLGANERRNLDRALTSPALRQLRAAQSRARWRALRLAVKRHSPKRLWSLLKSLKPR